MLWYYCAQECGTLGVAGQLCKSSGSYIVSGRLLARAGYSDRGSVGFPERFATRGASRGPAHLVHGSPHQQHINANAAFILGGALQCAGAANGPGVDCADTRAPESMHQPHLAAH